MSFEVDWVTMWWILEIMLTFSAWEINSAHDGVLAIYPVPYG